MYSLWCKVLVATHTPDAGVCSGCWLSSSPAWSIPCALEAACAQCCCPGPAVTLSEVWDRQGPSSAGSSRTGDAQVTQHDATCAIAQIKGFG